MHKHLKSPYLFSEPLVDPESRQYTKIDRNLVEKHRFECPYNYSDPNNPNHRGAAILPRKNNRKMKFSRLFGLRPIPTPNNQTSEESIKENKRGKN